MALENAKKSMDMLAKDETLKSAYIVWTTVRKMQASWIDSYAKDILKYPARSSLSFVMALFTAGKSDAAQYDCLLPAVILACFSGTPSFRRLRYLV